MNAFVARDTSETLARFVAETRYDALPENARHAAKRCILDTLGVTAAASTLGLGHKALHDMIANVGGTKEASVIGFGGRVPVWLAALANGAMARAVDFDDGHDESMTHSSSVIVPAALAMAERRGNVSGRDLITAVAVGNEVLIRLGLAIARRPGGLTLDTWFPSSVFGSFGGTAASCRVLGLDAETTRSAFGVTLFSAAGTLEAFSASGQHSMMRGMVTGLAAKSATLATDMAAAGITGVSGSIDGEFGLYNVYFGGAYHRPTLIDDLGSLYHSADIGMKPWPTCRYTHSYIDAAIQLAHEMNVAADAIAAVRLFVAGYAQSRCVPLAQQQQPTNFNHAGHALPYLVAAALVRRRLTLEDLVHRLQDPAVLDLAQRIAPVHDPRFSAENRIGPSRIEVDLKGGQTHAKQLDAVYGGVGNPISWDDLVEKFRQCVAHSINPPSAKAVDHLIGRIEMLENVTDVSEIARALA